MRNEEWKKRIFIERKRRKVKTEEMSVENEGISLVCLPHPHTHSFNLSLVHSFIPFQAFQVKEDESRSKLKNMDS